MVGIVGALRISLGLETAAFERGTRRAAADVDAFGTRAEKAGFKVGQMGKAVVATGGLIAGSAIVGQLKDLVTQGLEYAGALGEQAQKLGVSTKALQQYRYVASQVGLSADEMDSALAKLTRTMGEAAGGAKGPSAAFDKLGIDIKAFVDSGRDAGDLLPLIAAGLEKIPTPAERAAIMVDLLGKSGQKLTPLMNEGAKGIERMRREAAEFGLVLSDKQIQDADKTADKISRLQQAFQIRIAGVVSENANEIGSMAEKVATLADGLLKLLGILQRLNNTPIGQWANKLNSAMGWLNPAVAAARTGMIVAEGMDAASRPTSGKPAVRRVTKPAPSRSGGRILLKPNPSTYRGGLGPLTTGLVGDNDNRFGDAGLGLANLEALGGALRSVKDDTEEWRRVSRTAADQTATAFGESAQRIVGSLQGLASSLQGGGGFLGILASVIDLGMALGGTGLFGKKLAQRINNPTTPPITPRAMGGPVMAGRLHLVGERGPELFVPGQSGSIVPNHKLGGGGIAVIRPSPYFDVVVDGRVIRQASGIMDGGAKVAQRRSARAQSRRLA